MQFAFAYFLLAATAVLGAENQPATTSVDIAAMQGQISQLIGMLPPVPTDFKPAGDPAKILSSVGAPPPSLVRVIMTSVPSNVFADVINPASRKALASDFKAGKTPDWYNNLPTEVKEYVSGLAAKMTSEGVSMKTDGPLATGISGGGGGSAKAGVGSQPGSGGSSSSSALAPRNTGAVAGSLAVVMGVFAAAIAL
ncbi:hypothetical protein AJ79_00726 [Helicocarpus griseus UAMH5409]|uniref:Uncharacterized protein n=1 Tax=Helicocarpus griseus UAMH5409 TaxID=1447875 RepID=A0A2B7YB00_9EURO|nr:hypothetical protein AJ79_00726 [Helicocarpus griseus UAMH5409]